MITKIPNEKRGNKEFGYTVGDCDEYRGLSTDTKPSAVNNGDVYLEMDTGKVFFYDAEGEEWLEV